MKMVVTGGAGFIGTHLVNRLVGRGHEVHVIDNLTTGDPGQLHNEAVLHVTDVGGAQAASCIRLVRPDVVFHLAAQADVQRSIQSPAADASANITGTILMLDACRAANVRKIVFASTSGVYGDLQKDFITEEDPVSPISFYALSKLTAEQYIRLYGDYFDLDYTILRYGNVYGPGQTAKGEGGVVAVFRERMMNSLPLRIFGDGNQTRDFIYVQDVVSANLAAMEAGSRETLHISTGVPTSINRLVEIIRDQNEGSLETEYVSPKAGDILHSCLNNRKALSLLDWKPEYSVERGIAETMRHRMASSPQRS